jgi:cytochrome c oxidase subunit 2
MFSDASTLAAGVDFAFFFILLISVLLLILITFLMIFFVVKYHKKKNKKPQDIEGNTLLEIIWIVIPTILVLGMFYYGWVGFEVMRDIPEDYMVVNVEGRMWGWSFKYESGKRSDVLRVPLGKNIKLLMISKDVIHSLYIPAFRVKEDVVPKQQTYMWFVSNRVGTYDIFCAEYCGVGHSRMGSKVIVMPEKDFEKWYRSTEEEDWASMDGNVLLDENGCLQCHSTDGSKMLGPTLKNLYGKERTVLTEGTERKLIANEEYIKKSLLEPEYDIVKGYQPIMPSSEGVLSEKQIEAMTTYIKDLK